jgi:hypothetical protein
MMSPFVAPRQQLDENNCADLNRDFIGECTVEVRPIPTTVAIYRNRFGRKDETPLCQVYGTTSF